MEDGRIIELFYERSEQAIAELSEKYGVLCHRIADNILKDAMDAEECVNDAYLAVWNTVPPQRPDPLSSYLCRIVRNLAVKKYHQKTAKKRNSFYDVAIEEISECLPSGMSVEEEFEAREMSRLIDSFLETLDPDSRIMFVLRYWHSCSVGDIAKRFHVSSHYVSVRLFRIRKSLKKYLDREGVSQ